jgi:hypothetical protein
MWRLFNHTKILVASFIPKRDCPENAPEHKKQFRQHIHLHQLLGICHNHHQLLHGLVVLATCKVNNDPYPVILCITDNTSALNWVLHTSKKSIIGRAHMRLFCGF